VATATLPPLTLGRAVPDHTDVLVVGGAGPALHLVGLSADLDAAYRKQYGQSAADLASALGAKAKPGRTTVLPATTGGPRVLLVGLGDAEPTPEALRRAAGAGVRDAAALAGDLPLVIAVSLGANEPETLQAVAEGALLGSYAYAPVSAKPAPVRVSTLSVVSAAGGRPRGRKGATQGSDKSAVGAVDAARTIAEAVVTARDWVNIPPNLLYPASFAEHARELFAGTKATVEVLDEKALTDGGYGGIMAVGGGSSRPPRLVRVTYAPRGATVHLALVGKGITFDSGGLNIKVGDGMYTMKCDMAGAAAVLAATSAIASLGLKIQVTCYASMAENLPSDTAYRPSDVLTMYGGTTVENGNTDAEGRLVMADALARAALEDEPDLIVDVATLTGACVVALGDRTAGVMASSDEVAARILDAAETSGEDFWPLPIPADTREQLDSKVADVKSTSGKRWGGALVAAAFLREFVGDHDWAHLDIAGPAFHEGAPYGYTAPGGTGVAVRTLVALATGLQQG